MHADDLSLPPAENMRACQLKHLLALVIGAGVPYIFLIYEGHRYHQGVTASIIATITASAAMATLCASFLYLLFGGGWLLCFLYFVSCESLASLNLRTGSWFGDMRDGILLCLANIVVSHCANQAVSTLPGYSQTTALQDISSAVGSSPAMMVATVVYTWTAAALFEELLRTFCITRIMKFGATTEFKMLAVAISTILFACYHLYYGLYGAVVIGVTGLLFGVYYVYRGRAWAVILAHGLYGTYTWLANLHYFGHL